MSVEKIFLIFSVIFFVFQNASAADIHEHPRVALIPFSVKNSVELETTFEERQIALKNFQIELEKNFEILDRSNLQGDIERWLQSGGEIKIDAEYIFVGGIDGLSLKKTTGKNKFVARLSVSLIEVATGNVALAANSVYEDTEKISALEKSANLLAKNLISELQKQKSSKPKKISNSAEKLFSNGKPKLLIAEVASYGVYELRDNFIENMYDKISDKLRENFQIKSLKNLNVETSAQENSQLSLIHMNAIANGRLYRRELAGVKMIKYGDTIKGKEYYQDEEKTAARMKLEGKPYRLSPDVEETVKKIGADYGVDYLFFCNVRDADVWRKSGGIFGVDANDDSEGLRGKRVQVEMEYYLVNAKTGKVFEGQNTAKKTSLKINVLFGNYGTTNDTNGLLDYVLDDQAAKLAKVIKGKGINAVKGE